jgi:hypothetical protein
MAQQRGSQNWELLVGLQAAEALLGLQQLVSDQPIASKNLAP